MKATVLIDNLTISNTANAGFCWIPALPELLPKMRQLWDFLWRKSMRECCLTPISTILTDWRIFLRKMKRRLFIFVKAPGRTVTGKGGFFIDISVSRGDFWTAFRTEYGLLMEKRRSFPVFF